MFEQKCTDEKRGDTQVGANQNENAKKQMSQSGVFVLSQHTKEQLGQCDPIAKRNHYIKDAKKQSGKDCHIIESPNR